MHNLETAILAAALFGGAILSTLAAPATPQPNLLLESAPGLALRNIRVVDGDTLFADVILPYGIVLEAQYIRAIDYDAWESKRIRKAVGEITDEEIEKGKKAAEAMQGLVDAGLVLTAPTNPKEHRDNYGRLLGTFWSDGHRVNAWMRRHGHCRPEKAE